jgi:hypothetical protein
VTFIGFINGLIGVTLNDGCGFIDNQGWDIIPLFYETAYSFKVSMQKIKLLNEMFFKIYKRRKTNE